MAIARTQQSRQQYGLGKLVKKAFKGVKKVFKSPIGKAAILGGLGWGLGGAKFLGGKGIFAGGQGLSRFANLKNIFGAFGKTGKLSGLLYSGEGDKRALNYKKLFGLGAAGMIAAPFIQKKLGYGPYQDEEEEGPDWSVTPGSISNIVSMARAQDPSLNFLPSSAYTQSGFYGADGGLVGLANGGNPGEAQMEQMLRAEYLKYKNQGGTMPYEQFKILVMKQAQQGQMPNQMMAAGGRARYQGGEMVEQQTDLIEGPQGGEEFQETVVEGQEHPSREQLEALAMEIFQLPLEELDEQQLLVVYKEAMQGQPMEEAVQEEDVQFAANGGRMGYNRGRVVYPGGYNGGDPIDGYGPGGSWNEGGGGGGGNGAINTSGGDTITTTLEPSTSLPEYGFNWKNAFPGGKPFYGPVETKEEDVDTTYTSDPTGTQNLGILHPNPEIGNRVLSNQEKKNKRLTELMNMAQGGRAGFKYGGSDDDDEDILNQSKAMSMYRTRRQEGGLMDLGGQEKDYRDEGGFVPLGGEERADDVPARLSKNEFVFTADAVRAAGGGDIDAGSEVMQNVMDNLEQGGEVSEESQGQNPAQGMYNNYEQLKSRVA